MDETALVGDRAVRADKDIVRDRLAEDFDFEHVCDDLLRLAVPVRVHQGDMVVARNDVAERREPFFDALECDRVRKRVAQVLQLLVSRGRGHEEPMAVARGEAADNAGTADGGMH